VEAGAYPTEFSRGFLETEEKTQEEENYLN
jgi:hypothetical protein